MSELFSTFNQQFQNAFQNNPALAWTALLALGIGLLSYMDLLRRLWLTRKQADENKSRFLSMLEQLNVKTGTVVEEVGKQALRFKKQNERHSLKVKNEIDRLEAAERRMQGLEAVHETRVAVLEMKLEITLIRNKMDFALNFSTSKARQRFSKYAQALNRYEDSFSPERLQTLYTKFEQPAHKSKPGEYEKYLPEIIRLKNKVYKGKQDLRTMAQKLYAELDKFYASLEEI